MAKLYFRPLIICFFAGLLLAMSLDTFSYSNDSNIQTERKVRNCVDSKTGNARLILSNEKCLATERLVKLVIPKITPAEPAQLLHGEGPPFDLQTGRDRDFYIDTRTSTLYGPRANGVWGPGIELRGKDGSIGAQGNSLLNGISDPIFATGIAGDFFLNTTSLMIFGPKDDRQGWGVGRSITGPTGQAGPAGPAGAPGIAGATGAIGPRGLTGGYGDYGSFYDTATVALVINTATPVPLNETAFSQGISIVDGSKMTLSRQGKYNIAFSLQIIKLDSGTDIVSIWLCRGVTGGLCTNIPWTNTDLPLIGNSVRAVVAWNFFVDAEPNDYFQLMISSSGTTLQTKILSVPAQSSPTRPEIPSAIVTINQIG